VNVIRIALLVLVAVCLAADLRGEPRTWRDTTGRSLKAEFLYADAEKVFLKLGSGKTTEVALGRLANEDLEFVQQWKGAREKKGIVFEAPLGFEIYRSKTFSAAQAQNAGYFPLESDESEGVLRLEFRRYGSAPKGDGRLVLRLHTANPARAGTSSVIRVYFQGKLVGSASGAQANSRFDIPIAPSVLAGGPLIEFTIKCGSDAVLIRSKGTGRGPQFLQLKPAD
jgi:hypothetical protein